jgi:tRNA(fMet)-specific endonuclease VapC
MLDTDISSYIMKENSATVTRRLETHRQQYDDICISVVTYAELSFGALKKNSARITRTLRAFLSLIRVVDFDEKAGDEYAIIRRDLEKNGTPSGQLDMLIAATAKACNAILVTNNAQHFTTISGLTVENWCE